MTPLITLTLRSGHQLYLRPDAIVGFYPENSGGSCIITTAPQNIIVEEDPDQIVRLLSQKQPPGDGYTE